MTRSILITILFSALAGLAHASTDQDLKKCAEITNAAERLFCYDSLVAGLDKPSVQHANKPQGPHNPTAASSTSRPAAASNNRNTRAESETGNTDSFGLEMQQARDGADEIQSRYDGSFTGWTGSTVFKLENGQVWKQSESDRMSLNSERPMITIKRGWFGAYYLKVEGANKSIKVKRIQ